MVDSESIRSGNVLVHFFSFKHVQCTKVWGESNSQKASGTDFLKIKVITKRTTVCKQRENSGRVYLSTRKVYRNSKVHETGNG